MVCDCVDYLFFMLRLYEDIMILFFMVEDVDLVSLDVLFVIGYGELFSVFVFWSVEYMWGDVECFSTSGVDIFIDFLIFGLIC